MDYILLFTLILFGSLIAVISVYFTYKMWSNNRKFEKSLAEHRRYLKMEKDLDTSELVKKAYVLLNKDKK